MSSPEILVRVRDGKVVIRPIAGTRPRGKTPGEDEALAAELLADPKERAEHLMLLDLGRNDVGRVAKIGTVKVTDSFFIERYSHVMHIVSNVEGELREDIDVVAALAAGFPAGTVSGAPKVRAMEIIDELEKDKRGIYAGCIGYFGAGGEMDTCIVLRASVVKDGLMHVQAGAGIVYDSVPGRRAGGMRQQGARAVPRGGGGGALRRAGQARAVGAILRARSLHFHPRIEPFQCVAAAFPADFPTFPFTRRNRRDAPADLPHRGLVVQPIAHRSDARLLMQPSLRSTRSARAALHRPTQRRGRLEQRRVPTPASFFDRRASVKSKPSSFKNAPGCATKRSRSAISRNGRPERPFQIFPFPSISGPELRLINALRARGRQEIIFFPLSPGTKAGLVSRIQKTSIGLAVLKTCEPLFAAGTDFMLQPCFHACLATLAPSARRTSNSEHIMNKGGGEENVCFFAR